MSSSFDTGYVAPGGPTPTDSAHGRPSPANWREALMGLIASRISLIRLESKEAASQAAKRAIYLLLAIGGLFFGWILLLAGLVACIAITAGWAWYGVALVAAVLHFVIAAIFIVLAKSSGKPTFTHTFNEFRKDREWIENYQDSKKSNV